MEPTINQDEKLDAEKEPLVTGHRAHDELLEKARIERPIHRYGHGIPIFPQSMIYLVAIAALVVILLALWWTS
jgi:hypothetical protein